MIPVIGADTAAPSSKSRIDGLRFGHRKLATGRRCIRLANHSARAAVKPRVNAKVPITLISSSNRPGVWAASESAKASRRPGMTRFAADKPTLKTVIAAIIAPAVAKARLMRFSEVTEDRKLGGEMADVGAVMRRSLVIASSGVNRLAWVVLAHEDLFPE
jgi:hypothetical protein